MNPPSLKIQLSRDVFQKLTDQISFANSGDRMEQQYGPRLQTDFPRIEQFWRVFVVPLTNRITGDKSGASIHFRPGVAPTLQAISSANYSLFTHLAFSKLTLERWDDLALGAIYTRLASAFDAFEALAIRLHVVLCECRSQPSPLLCGLSKVDFLKLAEAYYDKNYAKLKEYYLDVGKKTPPINIPTKSEILDEFLAGAEPRKDYRRISGDIRSFRNVIVHDVRVGMLAGPDNSLLIPRSSLVQRGHYRRWSEVEAAASDSDRVKSDFAEAKAQCATEIQRTVQVLNDLYETLLKEFTEEFHSNERSQLRELFGIRFDDTFTLSMSVNSTPAAHDSGSFLTPALPSGVTPFGPASDSRHYRGLAS